MITPNSGPSQVDGVSHRESQRDKDEDEDEEDEYGSGEDDGPLFPNSHTATLKQHKKVVSALSIDPSGARFASGAHDYDVKLWDFGGMGGGVGRAFKSFEPAENYYVRISFSSYCPHFVVIFYPFISTFTGGAAGHVSQQTTSSAEGGWFESRRFLHLSIFGLWVQTRLNGCRATTGNWPYSPGAYFLETRHFDTLMTVA
jgi:hypothetical protein